jgi:uncharacterized protein (TIGR02145 family)
MRTKLIYLIAIAITLAFAGCGKDDAAADPTLDLSAENFPGLAVGASSKEITITTNTDWTAAVDDLAKEWLTLSKYSGKGDATITVYVAANPYIGVPREGVITFKAGALVKEVHIGQTAIILELSVDKYEFDARAATADTTYMINLRCNAEWSAKSDATAWCTISPSSGSGPQALTAKVKQANTKYVSRTAIITVEVGTAGSLTITVTQAGELLTPPTSAASTETWTLPPTGTSMLWSDAIRVDSCKTDASDVGYSTDRPWCLKRDYEGKFYYYYNWAFVNAHGTSSAERLCPEPWQVPTRSDFQAVSDWATAQEGKTVADFWNEVWPGYGWKGQGFANPVAGLTIWSSTQGNDKINIAGEGETPIMHSTAYFFCATNQIYVGADTRATMNQVRCVYKP